MPVFGNRLAQHFDTVITKGFSGNWRGVCREVATQLPDKHHGESQTPHKGVYMRLTKTFILHLYIQEDSTEKLCGDITMLPERKPLTFKTAQEMVDLLRQLTHLPSDEPQPGYTHANALDSMRKSESSEITETKNTTL